MQSTKGQAPRDRTGGLRVSVLAGTARFGGSSGAGREEARPGRAVRADVGTDEVVTRFGGGAVVERLAGWVDRRTPEERIVDQGVSRGGHIAVQAGGGAGRCQVGD